MAFHRLSRRAFIKGSVSALTLSMFPGDFAFAQVPVRIRPEWQEFKTTANYASFINAIRTMRANNNASDRSSLQYWVNVHVNFCPHDVAYFLGWHRGYLHYFEQQLRIVSGDPELVVPYWDYYKNPQIPAEFTDPASGNPLYVPRVNTNVYNALWLRPFEPTVWNFQRGLGNAFEALLEEAPHNPIHNIIGGHMQTMQSPLDVIFYLHHANIDRLWHAWALPDGKGIPWTSATYWAGDFTYAADLSLPRAQCYHPNWVGADYSDNSMPTALPPSASNKGRIMRVQSQQQRRLARPPVGNFAAAGARVIDSARRSIGGAREVGLTENSVSVRVAVRKADMQSLQTIVASSKRQDGAAAIPAGPYKSVDIILDDVRVLPAGKLGGYFYKVYLNLPESGDAAAAAQDNYFLGTVGPFEIEAASHRGGRHGGEQHGGGAQLVFPATEALAHLAADDLKNLTVSLVRVSGEKSPKGRAITVGELRVEVSTAEPFDLAPAVPAPPEGPYRR